MKGKCWLTVSKKYDEQDSETKERMVNELRAVLESSTGPFENRVVLNKDGVEEKYFVDNDTYHAAMQVARKYQFRMDTGTEYNMKTGAVRPVSDRG